MKLAFFNCQMRSVPPKMSGGIEKIMNYLIKGILAKGHTITLFSTGDSKRRENLELVYNYPREIESMRIDSERKNKLNDERTLELGDVLIKRQHEFDLVVNFCLESALPVITRLQVPTVSRICEELNQEAIDRLSPYKPLNYISISYAQRKSFPDLNYVDNIYNGIDTNDYKVKTHHEDFMVFVNRISQQKNPHFAILAAQKLRKKLYILGKYKDEHVEEKYYREVFLPLLKANSRLVEWVGEVDQRTVSDYFTRAHVSLYPVSFNEPFGNSALESMASGCPAIAFNRGAYSETIVDGKTGFVVNNLDEMIERITKVDSIDRMDCRKHVERNFSVEKMVNRYMQNFYRIVNHAAVHKGHRKHRPLQHEADESLLHSLIKKTQKLFDFGSLRHV